MRTKKFPSVIQETRLAEVVKIANARAGHKVETTLDMLRDAGYTVEWRRVVWLGGVGSYQWMPRRGYYRVLVAATKSGFVEGKQIKSFPIPNVVQYSTTKARRIGYRYGWCVEC